MKLSTIYSMEEFLLSNISDLTYFITSNLSTALLEVIFCLVINDSNTQCVESGHSLLCRRFTVNLIDMQTHDRLIINMLTTSSWMTNWKQNSSRLRKQSKLLRLLTDIFTKKIIIWIISTGCNKKMQSQKLLTILFLVYISTFILHIGSNLHSCLVWHTHSIVRILTTSLCLSLGFGQQFWK